MFASFKQIIQLQRQIKDLLRQQITIFKDLGYIGKINDIVSLDLKDVPIPSQSIDLVVCYMGLHYLLQNPLEIFLKMIYRILRPNDTFIYDEQEDDIMIIVCKPEEQNQIVNHSQEIIQTENYQKISANPESNYFRPCEWFGVRILMQFGHYLNHAPFYYFPI
ncbi:unnamed protein product [Adineta steineri]|uniref:Methyltransferase type 11 domain-containing protein n=1 Tax=Adineta steineri TaxID=433720 RepID=A0A820J0N0_9BILA|nr:unnamed protein product [Adineta steineri]